MKAHTLPSAAAIAVLLTTPALAQSGGPYRINRATIDAGATAMDGNGVEQRGTAGQPDSMTLDGGPYRLRGGFWRGLEATPATPTVTRTGSPIATSTPTRTASSPPTRTGTQTPTRSVTHSPTRSRTRTTTPTGTRPATATATQSATGIASPTNTPTQSTTATPSGPLPTQTHTPSIACAGDCNGDGLVSISELVRMVNIALDNLPLDLCPAGDGNRDGRIAINELIAAVNSALEDCPGAVAR